MPHGVGDSFLGETVKMKGARRIQGRGAEPGQVKVHPSFMAAGQVPHRSRKILPREAGGVAAGQRAGGALRVGGEIRQLVRATGQIGWNCARQRFRLQPDGKELLGEFIMNFPGQPFAFAFGREKQLCRQIRRLLGEGELPFPFGGMAGKVHLHRLGVTYSPAISQGWQDVTFFQKMGQSPIDARVRKNALSRCNRMTTCDESDLRQLLRLMRDACLLSGSHEEKRRFAVARLGSLIGADFAEWAEYSRRDRMPRAKSELRVHCQPGGELLFTRNARQPFTERDERLTRWLAAEFPWRSGPAFKSHKGLARRERHILDLLLQSYGRKEISKRLGISLNTVQGYIKTIYLHFGVHSHAELLRQYFHTRGDEPSPAPRVDAENGGSTPLEKIQRAG
jgi:DNA-binding CsgD family transcriptional regulator